jgi:hypothetical protein
VYGLLVRGSVHSSRSLSRGINTDVLPHCLRAVQGLAHDLAKSNHDVIRRNWATVAVSLIDVIIVFAFRMHSRSGGIFTMGRPSGFCAQLRARIQWLLQTGLTPLCEPHSQDPVEFVAVVVGRMQRGKDVSLVIQMEGREADS